MIVALLFVAAALISVGTVVISSDSQGKADCRAKAKIARDQTARIWHNSELEHALDHEQRGRSDAESANALKDEFLAIMSHELRHPLNLIHINVELLERLPEIAHSALSRRATSAIRSSVMSQAKIIDDLLDMSRVRTGKLSLSMTPVELGPVVQGIVDESARARASASGCPCSTATPARSLPLVWHRLTG